MQVLGDLVILPETGALPLPWWHRAPLGLKSSTWCFIAIVDSETRPVGDLIISVLRPQDWQDMLRIKISHRDEPGLISKAVSTVTDTNIALAESVTMESGSQHEITLVCEAANGPKEGIVKRRLREIELKDFTIQKYPKRELKWIDKAEVEGGWIFKSKWLNKMHTLFGDRNGFDKIDLSKAVISADTDNRLLRFVFPYKESRTIKVEHSDEPGALKNITDIFLHRNLNILSMLLRRGGVSPGNAEVVAVCEIQDGEGSSQVYESVLQDIGLLPPENMASVSLNEGIQAPRSITATEPGTIMARMPRSLESIANREKTKIPFGKFPVFFSHRFTKDETPNLWEREVRNALEQKNCVPLESSPEKLVRDHPIIFSEVFSKMWIAKAGIVLVSDLEDADALGKNLPHEFGFLQGQAKPILLLVENNNDLLRTWTNIEGVYAPSFPSNQKALDKENTVSIKNIIYEWIDRIRDFDYTTDYDY